MIFSLFLLNKISGAPELCLVCGVCMLVYFAGCFLVRQNREKPARSRVLAGWCLTEILCGLLWYLIWFPGGTYHNYGIGGAAGVLLYPLVSGITGVAVTVLRKKRG